MKGILCVGIVAGALTACGTSPVLISEATVVPAERIFIQTPHAEKGWPKITVVRDSGFRASGCDFGFYLDGKVAAHLAVAERVSFYVAPGEHILGAASVGRGLCALDGDQRREIATSLVSGDSKVYRISFRSEGGIAIEPTTMLQSR